MRGKIISISDQYGFIRCTSGVSHHFNRHNISEGVVYEKLSVGDPVEFSPKAATRGMKALNVIKAEVISGYHIPKKTLLFKRGTSGFRDDERLLTQGHVQISSHRTRSLVEAQETLKSMAIELGANCLYDVETVRTTGNEGNYQFSLFVCRGKAGIYGKLIEYATHDDKNEGDRIIRHKIESLGDCADELEHRLKRARYPDLGENIPYYIGLLFVVFFGILAIAK